MRLKRYLRYHYFKMIRLRDTPAKVAWGAGLGLAMDFAIPIPLVSIFLAFLAARILKVNSFAAVMSATVIKPFFPGIVLINVYVQSILVSLFPVLGRLVLPRSEATNLLGNMINGILSRGVPYLLAGLINGLVVFAVSYMFLHYILNLRLEKLKFRTRK
ncbi:DUF2062 domain-containing protein [Phosphitispora fastidiosa]|uniref:DUF2062 domain-containing protein n=1 Tax=Phosphitispora fastidiosa TaxID=2837202 RepID=UPI001E2DB652|nr:DUF2062 domain-containing protein [Phosphitispora fastidiosa]MBU7007343.1 protein of unknown function (DUF2062 family) [Phosphitispora fastidiosa]